MQAPPHITDARHQLALDEAVDVFIVTRDPRRIRVAPLENRGQAAGDRLGILRIEHARARQGFGPGEAAGHIVFEEAPVERERHAEIKRGRIPAPSQTVPTIKALTCQISDFGLRVERPTTCAAPLNSRTRMSRRSTPTTRARPCSRASPGAPVLKRHVLRNSLLPTIAVVATQTGYLIGGLVVVETLFNYPGMGRLIFTAATQKDMPLLEAAVLIVGTIFLIAMLFADLLYSLLNPRIRYSGAE